MFEIRSAGPKGLGVFAKSLIPRGTRIFSERPLLSIDPMQSSSDIYTLSRLLSPTEKEQLLKLSSHINTSLRFMRWNQALFYTFKSFFKSFPFLLPRYSPSHGPKPFTSRNSLKEHVTILSIFRSNSFNISTPKIYQAVFPNISRINHACIPNAQGNWNQAMERFNVHATRDIEGGEEVSLSYLGDVGAVRSVRLEKLFEGYGFNCGCQACDLSSKAGQIGEERRLDIKTMLARYAEDLDTGEECVEKELETTMKFIDMLETEGIAGREVASMYLVATTFNEGMGRMEEARRCAERAGELDRHCLGVDHETYLETMEVGRALLGRSGG